MEISYKITGQYYYNKEPLGKVMKQVKKVNFKELYVRLAKQNNELDGVEKRICARTKPTLRNELASTLFIENQVGKSKVLKDRFLGSLPSFTKAKQKKT